MTITKRLSGAAALAALLSVAGCTVDELYTSENITSLDPNVTLLENGLSIPLAQSTAKFRVDSILKKSGVDTTRFGEFLKTDENGGYSLCISGNYSLDSLVESLNLPEIIKIDAVDFNQKFTYDMGNFDASSFKIDGRTFGETKQIDDFSDKLDIKINPIRNTITQKAGLVSNSGYSISYTIDPIELQQLLLSKSEITAAASAAQMLGQATISFPDAKIPVSVESQKIAAVDKPAKIKSISEVKLNPGAKAVISLEVRNSVLSGGSINPDITIDLTDVLKIKGISGPLNLAGLTLNKANNYKVRKEYPLEGVNVSKLFTEKTVSLSGNLEIAGASATTASASAVTGPLAVDISLSLVDFDIEALVCEINPVSKSVSKDVPVELPSTTLPDQVSSVSGLTFTDASQFDINITAKNLEKFSGLNAKLSSLVIDFPAAITVSGEGVIGNTLTISNADLAHGLHKTLKVTSVSLPGAVGGVISYSDNIKVSASMDAGGTIDTATLPKTDADDIELIADVIATLAVKDFSAEINPISKDVRIDNTEIRLDLPSGAGDFGTFTIAPKGSPALSVSLDIPDLGGLDISAGSGITVTLPDIVKFKSVPSELNYNEKDGTITIRDIRSADYTLPIDKLVITPKKVGDGYAVITGYSANGTLAVAGGTVDKATIERISGASIRIEASIPDLYAESISLDELAYDVDQKFKFNIIEAKSISEMLVSLSEIELADVCADIDFTLAGLPDIGNGRFNIDLTAKLPDFIDPSSVELKGEVGSDGKFSQSIRINGFDLSNIDFAQLREDKKALSDSISISGKVSADHPSIDINTLSGKIKASVNVKISDSDNQIGVKSLKAKVDYQLDTLIKFNFKMPEVLKGCKFDLPDVTLNADVRSNLAVPLIASADINSGLYKLDLNFPYSGNPKDTLTVGNAYTFDFNPILNSGSGSLDFNVRMNIDKTRDCYIRTDAKYVLGVDYSVSCPIQLGESFEYVYADTLALGKAAQTIEQVLEYSGVGITADVNNALSLSVAVEAELLAYDKETDTYRKVGVEPVKSELLKAKSQSKLSLILKADQGQDLSGISHIRFSATVTSNGDTLKPEDYLQLSKVAAVIPEGITININTLK